MSRFHLASGYLILGIFLSSAASASTWSIQISNSQGKSAKISAKMIEAEEDGRRLIFMAIPSPQREAKSAKVQIPDAQELEVPIRIVRNQPYLLLPVAQGKLQIQNQQGGISQYAYTLESRNTFMTLSPTCRSLGMRITNSTQVVTPFPALMSCVADGKTVSEITFSSLGDSEWFGTNVFETAGKGERWKSFVKKDFITASVWDLSWGDSGHKNKIRLQIPPAPEKLPKLPKLPKPPFHFSVGANYLNGQADNGNSTTSLSGIQIPIKVVYQRDLTRLALGAGYDFFVYSVTGSSGSGSSVSGFNLWTGYDFSLGLMRLRPSLGYRNRAIDTPDLQTSSSFEAPDLGLEAWYGRTAMYGLSAHLAQTLTGDRFTEMELSALYEVPWATRKIRGFVSIYQDRASTTLTTFKSSWIALGALIQF